MKATKWGYMIALWLAAAGSSIVVLYYCLSCPPVAALLAYVGELLLALIAMPLYMAICIISAIFRAPVCF